ncbi:HK97 family phage prohead protease [Parerythrobacter jejuensis]|uniref:HK97 family phage prohead protease n=1 Tax=Parerythrobacter jejuensis TaxID=795812 RepID=A0A845AYE1_9SPHN|nr:HK97 family phage prohead protease [Parerythrobacter jejuensis]MXP30756.1 HK97 family phage prohead protease [Parerythrobacter jejuensis]MXP33516.1 HK97 family phage prohead protease [Parerythrobacter jejuensis]
MRLAGYAAVFGTPDAANDIIIPGAFARTLAVHEGPLPLFWQHRPDQRIGSIEHMGEDDRGLRVVAVLDNATSQAAAMLRARSVSGLSFGYRARRYRKTARGRLLEEIDLFEISLVTHPLQHAARVHFVS